MSTLPYESRGSLIEHGVIEPVATAADDAVEIGITAYGWELIDACAEQSSDEERDEQRRHEAEAQLRRAYENREVSTDSSCC